MNSTQNEGRHSNKPIQTDNQTVAARRTGSRCLKRYHQQGWSGLEARSCRPHTTRTRQWTKHHQQAVLYVRQRYPLWGKRKIGKVLCRDHGFTLSTSTVGRILKRLIGLSRIRPVAFFYGQVKPKRQRQFKRQALALWHEGQTARRTDAS